MIKRIHLNSVASDQKNNYLQLLKLPCSRMGKHISEIKLSHLASCTDILVEGGRLNFSFEHMSHISLFCV